MAELDQGHSFVFVSDSMSLSDKLLRQFGRLYVSPTSLPRILAADVYWRLAAGVEWLAALRQMVNDAFGDAGQSELAAFGDSVTSVNYRLTAVTSIFNGDLFLHGFLVDAAQWREYEQCEHFLVRAGSLGNEHAALLDYVRQHANAVYINLVQDPGLYAVWNMGVRLSTAPYLTSANLDDRRAPEHAATLSDYLDKHADIALVSAELRVTATPDMPWSSSNDQWLMFSGIDIGKYGVEKLFNTTTTGIGSHNLPHCMPVWRRILHTKAGYFSEEKYGPSADWALWVRAGLLGSRFAFLPSPMGLYLRHAESYWRRTPAQHFDRRIVAEFENCALHGVRLNRLDLTLRQRVEETQAAFLAGDPLGIVVGLIDCILRLRHFNTHETEWISSHRLVDWMALHWLGLSGFVSFIDRRTALQFEMTDPLDNALSLIFELMHEFSASENSSSNNLQPWLEQALIDAYLLMKSITALVGMAYLRRIQGRTLLERTLLDLAVRRDPYAFEAAIKRVYRSEAA